MEPEAKYTLVGTVVLILMALLTVAIFWLNEAGGKPGDLAYSIYFENQSLDGLQINSGVNMRGIKVGSVSSFRISTSRPGTVYVLIRVDPSTPVRNNTEAAVERNLLTGLANITLLNPDEKSPLLTSVPPGEEHPVIAEGQSEYQRFSQSLTQMVIRADDTMQHINSMLSDDNRKAFLEILTNLNQIIARIDGNMNNLDHTVISTGKAAEDFRVLIASLSKDASRLAKRYDALGKETTTGVREFSAATRRTEQSLARLVSSLEALADDGNLELKATTQELRNAANTLAGAARKFNEPRKIILGPGERSLGPGESLR